METKPVINIIGTRCRPEDEEKFNKWYDEIHIPLVFRFKGLKAATRYKITHETEEYPKYVTIYEFESQEAFEAYDNGPEGAASNEDTRETWKERGLERKWRVQYERIKTWQR